MIKQVINNEYNFYSYSKVDVGCEKWWRGSAPYGWMIEAGQLLNRNDYAGLFEWACYHNFVTSEEEWQQNKLYGLFSFGDNSTTFRMPDMRGQFIRSFHTGVTKNIGEACGSGLPELRGALWLGEGAYFGGCNGVFASLSGGCNEDPNSGNWGAGTVNFLASNCNPIYGASNEVTPPNVAFNWIIKY